MEQNSQGFRELQSQTKSHDPGIRDVNYSSVNSKGERQAKERGSRSDFSRSKSSVKQTCGSVTQMVVAVHLMQWDWGSCRVYGMLGPGQPAGLRALAGVRTAEPLHPNLNICWEKKRNSLMWETFELSELQSGFLYSPCKHAMVIEGHSERMTSLSTVHGNIEMLTFSLDLPGMKQPALVK